MKIGNISFIEVDHTHIIEATPEGNYYPRHLVNPQWKDNLYGWGFYIKGNHAKMYRSEGRARAFIAASK